MLCISSNHSWRNGHQGLPELSLEHCADWALSLAGRASDKFGDDVEVAEVPGVLLEQVEQDPLQRRRLVTIPAFARLAGLGEVVRLDDCRAPPGLVSQRGDQVIQGLVRGDIPASVLAVAPRLGYVLALETPLQPAHLDVLEML